MRARVESIDEGVARLTNAIEDAGADAIKAEEAQLKARRGQLREERLARRVEGAGSCLEF